MEKSSLIRNHIWSCTSRLKWKFLGIVLEYQHGARRSEFACDFYFQKFAPHGFMWE